MCSMATGRYLHAGNWRTTAVLVTIATFTADVIVCSSTNFQSAADAAGAGLCRVYSYNVEMRRLATAPSSAGAILMTSSFSDVLSDEVEQTPTVWNSRRYFVCCHDDGAETACRDRTYQQPDDVINGTCITNSAAFYSTEKVTTSAAAENNKNETFYTQSTDFS